MKHPQRKWGLVATLALLVSTSACNRQAEVAAISNTSTVSVTQVLSDFRPGATVQDIMLSVIDPNIDPIWNSISTESSGEGTVEIRPQTDADWETLRNHAITLREAANLLVIPGRKVAHLSTSSHHTELEARAIEILISSQWPAFVQRAHALQDAVDLALEAIEAKNVDRLEEAGGIIEHTCEGCHSQFWYPGDKHPGISN
jgi:cytochrome c556